MKIYTLKLKTTSTTNYNLYDGTTLVSDSDLATLFATAGEAYFQFDFNSLTPTNTTSLTILNSQDTAVITNTGLTGIAEDKNFKGTWGASATAFTSFELLKGMTMDEAQLGKLAGMIKNVGGIKTLTTADYDYPVNDPQYIRFSTLPSGTSKAGETVRLYFESGSLKIFPKDTLLVKQTASASVYGGFSIDDAGRLWVAYDSNSGRPYKILSEADINDTLVSTSTKSSLSANHGKVLNNKIVVTTETATITTTDWTALTGSDPYDYSATITATATIDASTGIVELLNDQPALFGTYGFAIGAVSGQSVTIYSIGQPDASVSLKLNIRNL